MRMINLSRRDQVTRIASMRYAHPLGVNLINGLMHQKPTRRGIS
jgi:hypothetical protein